MSKNAMSFFLRQLITESRALSSLVPPRAHDIRGIATSLNYYSNLSISAIKEAATWKSNRVFAMRYLKDMSATRSQLSKSPPSPNMAAAAPAKRKFRKCSNCTSRMPSFSYDNHTLCTRCRNHICDMEIVCEECRDWPLTKRKVFVNYNNRLRMKREYKQRQARLAGAASDQSVYETDTDVPLDEPSVPVQNVHLDELGQ